VQPVDCTDTVELELHEYEGVRSTPTVFVIARGHELREIENLIEVTTAVDLTRRDARALPNDGSS